MLQASNVAVLSYLLLWQSAHCRRGENGRHAILRLWWRMLYEFESHRRGSGGG
jgi:hypothetical protein